MLEQTTVQAVLAKTKPGVPVLSVYVDINSATGLWKDKVYRLQRSLDALEAGLEQDERNRFLADRTKVEAFVREYKARGKGLVLFSSDTQRLWWMATVQVPMRDEVRYQQGPYVKPLAAMLDQYQRYALVLVDNEKARLFVVHMGEIEEQDLVRDYVPKRHSQTEHNAKVEQQHATRVRRHLVHVVDTLQAMHAGHRFNRLVAGGSAEALPKFERELPKPLADLVIGHVSLPMTAAADKILAATLEVEQAFEEQKESRTVEEAITRAAKRHDAVAGPDETLFALKHKDVFELIVAGEYRLKGSVCQNCGLATATMVKQCPVCQGPMGAVDDVVEKAIEQAEAAGARVEVVAGPARERLIQAGGMAAFTIPVRH